MPPLLIFIQGTYHLEYEKDTSSLEGGGLFVGAVVAGAIMLVNGGAKARGALLRDVAALGLAVCTITAFLSAGAMSYARGGVLLAEYVAFVLIVLGADLWHIFTRCAGVHGSLCLVQVHAL